MKKMKAIIVDLDNTVVLEKKIQPLPVDNDRESWDRYHADMKFYDTSLHTPIPEMIDLIESYFDGRQYDMKVLFLTAREDSERGLIRLNTFRFIRDNFKTMSHPRDWGKTYEIFMRPENDFRPSYQVKEQILKEQILPYYDVVMAFDDDVENIKMFMRNGITALQVNSKDYVEFIETNKEIEG